MIGLKGTFGSDLHGSEQGSEKEITPLFSIEKQRVLANPTNAGHLSEFAFQ